MLENLLDLVKQHAGQAIVNNPAIPNEHNEAAIAAAGSSITDELKKMIASGNISDVASLFNQSGGNVSDHPVTQQISGNFIQTLMSKFGLGQGAASGIAASLIPTVLQNLVHKTNDPSDSSFNIQSIIGSLVGGGSSSGNAGGGGLDIQNIIGQFTGGGANAGGGIMDTLKGLMGK